MAHRCRAVLPLYDAGSPFIFHQHGRKSAQPLTSLGIYKIFITLDVNHALRHYSSMAIKSFKCAETECLFQRLRVRRFVNIEAVARRKLEQLEWAEVLDDLRVPPGNRLEALKGNRAGQHSIRINDQFRVCFVWTAEGARNVEIVDYH